MAEVQNQAITVKSSVPVASDKLSAGTPRVCSSVSRRFENWGRPHTAVNTMDEVARPVLPAPVRLVVLVRQLAMDVFDSQGLGKILGDCIGTFTHCLEGHDAGRIGH